MPESEYSTEMRHGNAAMRCIVLCALAALALAGAFALSGCKYSDVLTQHTEDPEVDIDDNAEPTYKSNPEAELELDLANLTLGEAQDQDIQAAMLPHYDPDAPDNGPTKQLKKSAETPHDEEASEGEDDGDADREGPGDGDNGGSNVNNSDGDQNNGNNEGNKDPLEGDSDETELPGTGGAGGNTVAVNPEGPSSDTAKGTIAAVGEYATIAQMLGGAGGLVACDETWLAARESDGCFSGELERVSAAFTGDGSKAGSCDVDMLINTVKPNVVLWDGSMPNLSESERKRLEAADIKVQEVPRIGEMNTEDYDVKAAVAEVASVLSEATGLQYDPVSALEDYNSFHDELLIGCCETNGGYAYKYSGETSLDSIYQENYISGLPESTTNRYYTVFVNSTTGGSSSLKVSRHTSGISTETSTYDASDGIGLSAGAKNSYLVLDYYLQLAGVVNNAYDTAKPDSKGRSFITMPGVATSNIGSADAFGSRSLDTGSAFSSWCIDSTIDSNWHQLGDADFGTVLVSDSKVQGKLKNSANKRKGLYHVGSAYDVVVVPSGIEGSWAEGHFDSFLVTPWAFRIQNASNLEAAESYVSSFYSKFLRCSDWSGAVANWDASASVD